MEDRGGDSTSQTVETEADSGAHIETHSDASAESTLHMESNQPKANPDPPLQLPSDDRRAASQSAESAYLEALEILGDDDDDGDDMSDDRGENNHTNHGSKTDTRPTLEISTEVDGRGKLEQDEHVEPIQSTVGEKEEEEGVPPVGNPKSPAEEALALLELNDSVELEEKSQTNTSAVLSSVVTTELDNEDIAVSEQVLEKAATSENELHDKNTPPSNDEGDQEDNPSTTAANSMPVDEALAILDSLDSDNSAPSVLEEVGEATAQVVEHHSQTDTNNLGEEGEPADSNAKNELDSDLSSSSPSSRNVDPIAAQISSDKTTNTSEASAFVRKDGFEEECLEVIGGETQSAEKRDDSLVATSSIEGGGATNAAFSAEQDDNNNDSSVVSESHDQKEEGWVEQEIAPISETVEGAIEEPSTREQQEGLSDATLLSNASEQLLVEQEVAVEDRDKDLSIESEAESEAETSTEGTLLPAFVSSPDDDAQVLSKDPGVVVEEEPMHVQEKPLEIETSLEHEDAVASVEGVLSSPETDAVDEAALDAFTSAAVPKQREDKAETDILTVLEEEKEARYGVAEENLTEEDVAAHVSASAKSSDTGEEASVQEGQQSVGEGETAARDQDKEATVYAVELLTQEEPILATNASSSIDSDAAGGQEAQMQKDKFSDTIVACGDEGESAEEHGMTVNNGREESYSVDSAKSDSEGELLVVEEVPLPIEGENLAEKEESPQHNTETLFDGAEQESADKEGTALVSSLVADGAIVEEKIPAEKQGGNTYVAVAAGPNERGILAEHDVQADSTISAPYDTKIPSENIQEASTPRSVKDGEQAFSSLSQENRMQLETVVLADHEDKTESTAAEAMGDVAVLNSISAALSPTETLEGTVPVEDAQHPLQSQAPFENSPSTKNISYQDPPDEGSPLAEPTNIKPLAEEVIEDVKFGEDDSSRAEETFSNPSSVEKPFDEVAASALTPVARGRLIVETSPSDAAMPSYERTEREKSEENNAFVEPPLTPNQIASELPRPLSGSALATISEAITPDASNVITTFDSMENNTQQKKGGRTRRDLIKELEGYAQIHPKEEEKVPGASSSTVDSTRLDAAPTSDGSDAEQYSDPRSSSEAIKETFEAGGLLLGDALATPSWVGPSTETESTKMPAVIDDQSASRPKRIEYSSMASVSSTISANSANRGLAASGAATPVVPLDNFAQGSKSRLYAGLERDDSVYSGRSGRSRSLKGDHSFAELLVNKLSLETPSSEVNEVESKWMKKQKVDSFDPTESIFAFMADDADETMSEPGSPPESNDEDSSLGSLEDIEQARRDALIQSAAVWDMIPDSPQAQIESDNNRPSYVLMSRSEDELDAASVSASVRSVAPPHPSDMSVSGAGRKRRGKLRRLSIDMSANSKNLLKKKKKYRYDPAKGFRANKHVEGEIVDDESVDETDAYSIAGGSVVEVKEAKKSKKGSSMTVSAMTQSQRQILLEHESRARNKAKSSKKKEGVMSLDAFFSSNNAPDVNMEPSESSDHDDDQSSTGMHEVPEGGPIENPESESHNDASSNQLAEHIPTNEVIDDDELLEENLRDICSPKPVLSPFIKGGQGQESSQQGKICWNHLQAKWKHTEMAEAIASKYPTSQFLFLSENNNGSHEKSEGSSSLTLPKKNPIEVNLPGRFDHLGGKQWKNRDGFLPHHGEASIPISSGFMLLLGGLSPVSKTWPTHKVDKKEASENEIVGMLLDKAENRKRVFASLLQDVVTFATHQQPNNLTEQVFCSTNIKSQEAILSKSNRKYKGNVALVKDVLRGEIVFPDEGSLVCGLVRLEQLCREKQKVGEEEEEISISVVRVKNSFVRDATGALFKSHLPTGYRHILITVSFDDGFLAEIQYQLLPLFDILGQDGYALHRVLQYGGGDSEPHAVSPTTERNFFTGLIDKVIGQNGSLNEPCPNLMIGSHSLQDLSAKEKLCRSVVAEGVDMVSQNPYDVSSYDCLLTLLSEMLASEGTKEKPDTRYVEFFRSSICNCLDLCNQINSTSFFGWLIIDESKPLDRLFERPLDLMHNLACVYAQVGMWEEAEDVFKSALLRCEHQLPLYHPRVLSSMLDVAIAARKNGKTENANDLLTQVSNRLSSYLSEMESTYFIHQNQSTDANEPGGVVAQHDFGREALQMMDAFASSLQNLLKRKIVSVVGPASDAILLNYSLLGDVLVVLANCLRLSEGSSGDAHTDTHSSNQSNHYWRLAFAHYRIAFKGYNVLEREKRALLAIACAGYGSAKSLHELGESEKALQLISIVVSSLLPETPPSAQADNTTAEVTTLSSQGEFGEVYLPHMVRSGELATMESSTQQFVAAAYCLWLMAVLTVTVRRNEEGRVQSLKLLHKSSVSLQYAMRLLHPSSKTAKASCVELLRKIEAEAKSILRPVRSASTRVNRPLAAVS